MLAECNPQGDGFFLARLIMKHHETLGRYGDMRIFETTQLVYPLWLKFLVQVATKHQIQLQQVQDVSITTPLESMGISGS